MTAFRSEEDRLAYDAANRSAILELKTECIESALERAFVEWWRGPSRGCTRTGGGPCAQDDCKVGHGHATTMCALYRKHLARAAAEGV
jgi:hypothetical protein